MDLHDIECVDAQPPEAALDRANDVVCDVVQVFRANFDFRVDDHISFEDAQRAPEIFFAKPVPIVGSIVEVSYPALQCPADDPRVFGRGATNHESGIATAAEPDLRHHKVSRTNAP